MNKKEIKYNTSDELSQKEFEILDKILSGRLRGQERLEVIALIEYAGFRLTSKCTHVTKSQTSASDYLCTICGEKYKPKDCEHKKGCYIGAPYEKHPQDYICLDCEELNPH